MGRLVRKISRVVPPIIEGEPRSEARYLNATAHWYSGDAWFLFEEIIQRCGLPTAKFIFQKCVSVAEEQENQAAAVAKARVAQCARELIRFPTAEEIAAADRGQISRWWARLPDRKYDAQETRLYDLLRQRYVELGGYTKDFKPNQLPPIKKHGSVKRNAPNRDLPALFDSMKAKSGGKLTQIEFAEFLISKYGARYGKDVENVIANWKYWRRKI
jgi:hypothetical protein